MVSDTATLYTSNDFFTRRTDISNKMYADLKEKVLKLTWHEVVFFQLRSLALPHEYEIEIQNTEVKGQDILKAQAEKIRDQVKFDTSVSVEALKTNATKELAKGDAQKILLDGLSFQKTIDTVVRS